MRLAIDTYPRKLIVKAGETAVTSDIGAHIICYGLGSCIGVFLYDKSQRVGACAHIVLPGDEKWPETDAMLSRIIQQMLNAGCSISTIKASLAGGASIMGLSSFSIGKRNITYIKQYLEQHKIAIQDQCIGGNKGRKARFDMSAGRLYVTTKTYKDHSII
ncbi:MAG: chemotaxis protein CheD [Bacteroidota bacterium]